MIEELADAGIEAKRQVEIPVRYRGKPLGVGFRADIIVENSLLIEVKSVCDLNDVHTAQIMTYLKLLRFKRGFLINFNKKLPSMKRRDDGTKVTGLLIEGGEYHHQGEGGKSKSGKSSESAQRPSCAKAGISGSLHCSRPRYALA